MVKILEIKRLFGLIQLILIVANISALVIFGVLIYLYNPSNYSGNLNKVSSLANSVDPEVKVVNSDVETISQKLMNLGLFGSAGRWNEDEVVKPKEEEPPQPVEDTAVEDTQLNLKLIGTIALTPKDKFASACIENQDKRITAFYAVGQEVMENVILEEVYPKEVILLNKRVNPARKERLKIEDKSNLLIKKTEDFPTDRVRVGRVEESDQSSVKEVEVNRDEIEREFIASYADLVTRIKPEMYRDESGKVMGVTAKNIGEIPLAKKLGFKDGDVLLAVNDEKIDSEDKIIDIIRKYSDPTLPAIKITILRDGKTMDVIYKIQ